MCLVLSPLFLLIAAGGRALLKERGRTCTQDTPGPHHPGYVDGIAPFRVSVCRSNTKQIPDTTHGTAIGLSINWSGGRHIWQSHGSCLGIVSSTSMIISGATCFFSSIITSHDVHKELWERPEMDAQRLGTKRTLGANQLPTTHGP